MFTYKEIEKDDLAALAAMYVETFNAPPWNDAWSQETAEIRLRQMAEAKTFYGICAFEGEMLCGMIFGFAEQFYDGVLFEIKEFCVKNTSRGNGIGSAIYREFEKRLRERNIKETMLMTLRGNATEHFYEKNGFETEKDLIFMKKQL